jgi:LacI family transcriptional regulator
LVYADQDKAYEWLLVRKLLINLEPHLAVNGYHCVLFPVNESSETETLYSRIARSAPRGVFSIHFGNEELFRSLEKSGVPVVLVNNSNYQTEFHSICADEYQGGYEGAKHLIDLGHKRIAFVEYVRPDLSTLIGDSFVGFKKALSEHGIEFSESWHSSPHLHDIAEIRTEVHRLIRDERVTAVFALDDYLAARIIAALADLSVSVPQDLSIIAAGTLYDYSEPLIPQITTMSIDTEYFCRFAAEQMIEVISEGDVPHRVFKIRKRLYDRGSCRAI